MKPGGERESHGGRGAFGWYEGGDCEVGTKRGTGGGT
jgi:hypothetical protein